MKRIWCYIFGHRPIRPRGKTGPYSGWTTCGRCRKLMVPDYYGYRRATRQQEDVFKRWRKRQAAQPVIEEAAE